MFEVRGSKFATSVFDSACVSVCWCVCLYVRGLGTNVFLPNFNSTKMSKPYLANYNEVNLMMLLCGLVLYVQWSIMKSKLFVLVCMSSNVDKNVVVKQAPRDFTFYPPRQKIIFQENGLTMEFSCLEFLSNEKMRTKPSVLKVWELLLQNL